VLLDDGTERKNVLREGGVNMTNRFLLEMYLKQAGFTQTEMAKAMGLTLNGFRKKLTNRTEFKQSEIAFISDHVNLTLEEREKIFFQR
jgi:hypothetical protein